MSLLKRFHEPIILKSSDSLIEEYTYVKKLFEETNNVNLKLKLKQLEFEVNCENNILEELKNSHIPMYILHNLNLEYGQFKEQIDFIIITKSNVYVIESRGLYGNIKIDNNGNFSRSYKIDNKDYLDKISSPIIKSNKHLELLKLIGYENKNMIDKIVFDKLFYNFYKPLIVLGDSDGILNIHNASYDIKNKVVKVHRLIDFIKEGDVSSNNKFTEKEMKSIANNILKYHNQPFICYDIIYDDYLNSVNEIKLEKELKKYRYYLAKKENTSIHLVFSDRVLKELISKKPKDEEALLEIKGLGSKRVSKYGSKLLKIISKYV